MKHLTVDEMLKFVSLTEFNSEAIELSAYVNGHIRECDRCLKLVGAFQLIYDEFSRSGSDCDLRQYVLDKVLRDFEQADETIETEQECEHETLDGCK